MDVLRLRITLLAAFLAIPFIAGPDVRRTPAGARVLSLLTEDQLAFIRSPTSIACRAAPLTSCRRERAVTVRRRL